MMTREDVVRFAMAECRRSKDWQEVQEAMANASHIREWLETESGGNEMDVISVAQSVIREAEERLGDKLPPEYS